MQKYQNKPNKTILMNSNIKCEYSKIAITSDQSKQAIASKDKLVSIYGLKDVTGKEESLTQQNTDVLLAVGGDGFMLSTLHKIINTNLPIYGLNQGTLGFLLNRYSEDKLLERISMARDSRIHPVMMECIDENGSKHTALAINEISLLRMTGQAAKIKVIVDNNVSIDEMICDGVLVATPAGSSAYNLSNGGMILPIKSNLLALTPICPFRPRRWRGAILPSHVNIRFEVLKCHKRPVKAVADCFEINNVTEVNVKMCHDKVLHLLFDPGHSLEERIIREQFEV